jgi:hypothetical protein
MKQRSENLRRHPAAVPAPRPPASPPQEADFTAEGSPPPGKVGGERPALPKDEQAAPAGVDGQAGKR